MGKSPDSTMDTVYYSRILPQFVKGRYKMKNYEIQLKTLIVEVTRWCNMECSHCLRGPRQRFHSTVDFDEALRDVTVIETIVFSGGEPSLPEGIRIMRKVLDTCRSLGIIVNSFYIVTNGKVVSNDFLLACLEWWNYIGETGIWDSEQLDWCGVALSQDEYHEWIPDENIHRLSGLAMFRPEDKRVKGAMTLLQEGKARTVSGLKRFVRNPLPEFFEDPESNQFIEIYLNQATVNSGDNTKDTIVVDEDLYLSATGELRLSCDMAYVNTASTIGNIQYRPLKEILLDFAGKEGCLEKLSEMYRTVLRRLQLDTHTRKTIPLKSGGKIEVEPVHVAESALYKDMDITDINEVRIKNRNDRCLAFYGTIDMDDMAHAARLATCLLLDLREELMETIC